MARIDHAWVQQAFVRLVNSITTPDVTKVHFGENPSGEILACVVTVVKVTVGPRAGKIVASPASNPEPDIRNGVAIITVALNAIKGGGNEPGGGLYNLGAYTERVTAFLEGQTLEPMPGDTSEHLLETQWCQVDFDVVAESEDQARLGSVITLPFRVTRKGTDATVIAIQ